MRRLLTPLMLVIVSIVSTVVLTTVTAVTLASYSKTEKNSNATVQTALASNPDHATVSR